MQKTDLLTVDSFELTLLLIQLKCFVSGSLDFAPREPQVSKRIQTSMEIIHGKHTLLFVFNCLPPP